MKFQISLVFFFYTFMVYGQDKKKIDYTAYNEWKTLRNISQSVSGVWVSYEVFLMEGDANLVVESTETGIKKTFPRGKSARFLSNESAVVFLIEPEYDTIRELKLTETNREKYPKDTLAIHWLGTDSVLKFPNVKSFLISKDNDWIVYLSTKDRRPDCADKQSKRQRKKNPCINPPTNGFTLTVYNPSTGFSKEIHRVTDYLINETGTLVTYVKSHVGDKDSLSVYVLNLNTNFENPILNHQFDVTELEFDDNGTQLAFLSSPDTNESKNYNLYLYTVEGNKANLLVDSATNGMPLDWTVSEYGRLYFSENGEKIFFGTNKIVRQEINDTLLESEKAQVDIWGSNDLRIQPLQLMEQNNDESKSYLAVYHIAESMMVQLAKEEVPYIRLSDHGNSNLAIGINDQPYLREVTWEYPWKSDFYLVNLKNGQSELLLQGHAFTTSLSPTGNYLVYYNAADSNWYSINTKTKTTTNITKDIPAEFASDNNGTPVLADDEGFIGWTLINNEENFLVNSTYDVWSLNPSSSANGVIVSDGVGIKEKVKFIYYRFDYDSTYTNLTDNLFIGIDEATKSESVFQIISSPDSFTINPLLITKHRITYISKAEKSDRIIIRRMSFTEYPDLEKTNLKFESPQKFTEINPQQDDYNWGTVEMVSWKTYTGENLRGLLYKPENFDSTKTYPMIVYFYEKYTDDIHVYYSPKPTASIIYPTEYVSNGYIVFIPDIEYIAGYPAKSAYNCIMSGTESLIRKFNWIDSTRMGLQGQSWGGYQTAQLITMTTKFKAAMAGAPVTNMTSAYGGIRWGSGYSRMFQYEKGQSRIGFTLWERPDLYMLNSPIFGLPNVQTPLLIMSNDGDGAVPWYQGIEMYMGLRRLNQPVWLLNYNGDQHNLIQLANKKDLSLRMRQFFDYYLLDAPIPIWMLDGVPATEKGTNFGLQLKNQ